MQINAFFSLSKKSHISHGSLFYWGLFIFEISPKRIRRKCGTQLRFLEGSAFILYSNLFFPSKNGRFQLAWANLFVLLRYKIKRFRHRFALDLGNSSQIILIFAFFKKYGVKFTFSKITRRSFAYEAI
jgi:hypothetical protein